MAKATPKYSIRTEPVQWAVYVNFRFAGHVSMISRRMFVATAKDRTTADFKTRQGAQNWLKRQVELADEAKVAMELKQAERPMFEVVGELEVSI